MLREKRGSLRALQQAIGVALFTALVLFVFSEPVAAKGPESATISGPGIEQPVALLDDASLGLKVRLMEQTGIWYAFGDLPRPIEQPAGALGAGYTLTWVNGGPPHKSVEERTMYQTIYPHAENGVLIHTPSQEGLNGWGPGVTGWFAAPEGLLDTLAEMGAPVPESAAPSSGLSAGGLWYFAVGALVVVVGLGGVVRVRRIRYD